MSRSSTSSKTKNADVYFTCETAIVLDRGGTFLPGKVYSLEPDKFKLLESLELKGVIKRVAPIKILGAKTA